MFDVKGGGGGGVRAVVSKRGVDDGNQKGGGSFQPAKKNHLHYNTCQQDVKKNHLKAKYFHNIVIMHILIIVI